LEAICDGSLRDGSAPLVLADWALERPKLCGGRGTERPAAEGVFIALLDLAPASGFALRAALSSLRAPEGSVLRDPCVAALLAELAGGVMRLSVGREVTPEAG